MGDVVPRPASFAPDVNTSPPRRLELSPAAAEILAQIGRGAVVSNPPQRVGLYPLPQPQQGVIDTTGQPVQVNVTVVNHVNADARAVAVATSEWDDDGGGWVAAMFLVVFALAVLAVVLIAAGTWFRP